MRIQKQRLTPPESSLTCLIVDGRRAKIAGDWNNRTIGVPWTVQSSCGFFHGLSAAWMIQVTRVFTCWLRGSIKLVLREPDEMCIAFSDLALEVI